MTWMQPAIRERRAMLTARLSAHLARIAKLLGQHLHDPGQLDDILLQALSSLAPASLVYVIDRKGWQRSSNISPAGCDTSKRGQDLSDRIYLRSGSLNVVNGLVGLNFSCDGSHYLPVEEFLSQDARFWF